ncbi:MAG: NADH-quinone oxidoreductase subunit L [Fimbriimonadaceae bacterium]|nr:NADH-quinone oxidoreductase subunit D [Chthonomonadaceae bacterium]MCO5295767.1 NADH-quinone oxidoreductase subunit L [Fimbriimonadaceae bacterium]
MKQVLAGPEVDSFYHLHNIPMEHRLCRGLSCFAAQARNAERWSAAIAQEPPVFCLGKCYMAPASADDEAEPRVEVRSRVPIVLDGVAGNDQRPLDAYRAAGGYGGLEQALAHPPEWTLAQIETAQLRGRGGAGFPAGIKWRAVAKERSEIKHVVANADEGDHGSYIDRFVMERTPHRVLEALGIAAHAVGSQHATIYLRKEYPKAHTALVQAMDEAREAGWIGRPIPGYSFKFDIDLVIGEGSYVCGEETSLIRSIEHRRPEVMARPPFPTQKGLFGYPTLVNNVETLASVPWIAKHGGDAYAAMGTRTSRGTKAVSLNSLFARPGLYEVEFGMPLRWVFETLGGGFREGEMKAAIMGGPLAGVLKPEEFDTPLDFEAMRAVGASVGHGGVVAFDQSTRMVDLLAHVFAFGTNESCGKCTPCRLGSRRALDLLRKAQTQPLEKAETAELFALMDALRQTSLCGHGSGLGVFAQSVFAKFGEELEPWFPS